MVTRIFAHYGEEQAFHWVGAATVTLWATLPKDVQEAIVNRALEMADTESGSHIRAFTNGRNGEHVSDPKEEM
jgi:hypothetical protein